MYPFDDHASWARNTALVRHLAQLAERVGALEKPKRKKRKTRNA
jgi:UDP-3-O-[3-hydroxymyristoyl] glucosamine N-acyltransferase